MYSFNWKYTEPLFKILSKDFHNFCNAYSVVLIAWRIPSCFSLDTGPLFDFSTWEGERFETPPSVFVALV